MRTARSFAPSAARTSFIRSWVSGRGGTTPCCANAIAVASTAPIQIGRYLSPATSRSSTMGWLVGISTRTPITSTSRTQSAYSAREGLRGHALGAQPALHQRRVQPHGERRYLPDRVLGTRLRARVPAALHRRDDLLHQPHFAVRGGLERPQVARLEPERGQVGAG